MGYILILTKLLRKRGEGGEWGGGRRFGDWVLGLMATLKRSIGLESGDARIGEV